MAEQVSGDINELKTVIEEANALKDSFQTAKEQVDEAINKINQLWKSTITESK